MGTIKRSVYLAEKEEFKPQDLLQSKSFHAETTHRSSQTKKPSDII